jgi:hypothetical protein
MLLKFIKHIKHKIRCVMIPVFRLCVIFVWYVLFPADVMQARCVLVCNDLPAVSERLSCV